VAGVVGKFGSDLFLHPLAPFLLPFPRSPFLLICDWRVLPSLGARRRVANTSGCLVPMEPVGVAAAPTPVALTPARAPSGVAAAVTPAVAPTPITVSARLMPWERPLVIT